MRTPTLALLFGLTCACDSADEATAESSPQQASAEENSSPQPDAASAFSEYQRKSMRAEAMASGRMIADLLRVMVSNGETPASIPVTPPPGSCCKQDKGVCPIDDGSWSDPAWKALGFSPTAPHRYSFGVDVDGSKVSVTATADLDCDGTLSTYTYEGTIADGDIDFGDYEAVETNPLD